MVADTAPGANQRIGIAVAVLLHVVVIGLLSVQWTRGDRRFDNPPMEVDLIAETAPTSTAPVISDTPPAARLGEEDATDIAAPEPVPLPPEPEPVVEEPTETEPPKVAPVVIRQPDKADPKPTKKKSKKKKTRTPTDDPKEDPTWDRDSPFLPPQ